MDKKIVVTGGSGMVGKFLKNICFYFFIAIYVKGNKNE